MYVTFHNDEAEHIDIDRDKNQHDDLTLHHLVKDIEKKTVVSNNTGTITTIDKSKRQNISILWLTHIDFYCC
jgi:hypothetical protein